MAKEIFLVAPLPVVQVEWTIPSLQQTWGPHAVNPQPLPPGGPVSAALPLEAMPFSLPTTGPPSQPGAGDAWASAVQALFAHEASWFGSWPPLI
jgi:hypothetical protein